MYLQNEKMPKLWVLSIFLTKEGSNKYIKLLCKMNLWDKLEKEEFVGKCSVKKAFLKTSQNSQEKPLLESPIQPQAWIFIKKETPIQLFSLEFGEIFVHLWWLLLYKTGFFAKFFLKKKVLNKSFFNLLL